MPRDIVRKPVVCPECGGPGQVVDDDPDYDSRRAFECLQSDCLHWEYRD